MKQKYDKGLKLLSSWNAVSDKNRKDLAFKTKAIGLLQLLNTFRVLLIIKIIII